MMKDVNFLITDLDDTIWDWLTMWHASFNPYLNRIVTETNVDIDTIKLEFKKLHRQYGTTEVSFAYKELPSIPTRFYSLFDEGSEEKKSILYEYYSNKKNNLIVYSGVNDTLKEIKAKGTKIIAFTESNSFFTKYRLRHSNLDGIIDCIYTPQDSGIPESVIKHYSNDYWEPLHTKIEVLPRDTRKPNPIILNRIISDYKAKKDKVVYVGDKLDRDVYMAQQAGVTSIYAEYGHIINDSRYALLREVTHWTDEDVRREIDFKSQKLNISPPDVILKHSYKELFDHFNFVDFA